MSGNIYVYFYRAKKICTPFRPRDIMLGPAHAIIRFQGKRDVVELRVCRSRCALRRILEEAAHGEEEKSCEKAGSKEGTEEIGARAKIAPEVPSSLEEGSARTEVDSGRSFAVGTRGRRCTAHAPWGPEGCVTVCSTEAPTLI